MEKILTKIQKRIHSQISDQIKVYSKTIVSFSKELDNWDDVVKRAGLPSIKFLGVINDIKLKGFKEEIKKPTIEDKAYDGLARCGHNRRGYRWVRGGKGIVQI